jgi:hypothetical protein
MGWGAGPAIVGGGGEDEDGKKFSLASERSIKNLLESGDGITGPLNKFKRKFRNVMKYGGSRMIKE